MDVVGVKPVVPYVLWILAAAAFGIRSVGAGGKAVLRPAAFYQRMDGYVKSFCYFVERLYFWMGFSKFVPTDGRIGHPA